MTRAVTRIAKIAVLIGVLASLQQLPGSCEGAETSLIVVVGADGEETYGAMFDEWAGRWERAARTAGASFYQVGGGRPTSNDAASSAETRTSDLAEIRRTVGELDVGTEDVVWLVLIGHGTFDGQTARFNLAGPDLSAKQLAAWTKEIDCRLVVINCASASAPFINALSGPNRTIVTATKNGSEQNFARFGDALSRVIEDNVIDFDKDGQTSLLEAVVEAANETESYYTDDGRLATEHTLIDDNADGRGTRVDWFRGVRIDTQDASLADGIDGELAREIILIPSESSIVLTAAQRQRRDEIERQLVALRKSRPDPIDEQYLAQIEPLMIELARIYSAAEKVQPPTTPEPPIDANGNGGASSKQ